MFHCFFNHLTLLRIYTVYTGRQGASQLRMAFTSRKLPPQLNAGIYTLLIRVGMVEEYFIHYIYNWNITTPADCCDAGTYANHIYRENIMLNL